MVYNLNHTTQSQKEYTMPNVSKKSEKPRYDQRFEREAKALQKNLSCCKIKQNSEGGSYGFI